MLAYDVDLQDDGTILVGSCSDPLKTYRLVGRACECKDFTDGRAPEGWCRHRIAAGIMKRVTEELMRSTPEEPEVVLPEAMEPFPDNDPEEGERPSQPPAPQPCPEALFSLMLKGHIDGHEALLTARGQSAAEFQRNLQAIRGLLDPPQPAAPPASQGQGQGWCAVHNTAMQANEKDGRRWFSHRTAQGWCKGR